jgi:hypothetical protein
MRSATKYSAMFPVGTRFDSSLYSSITSRFWIVLFATVGGLLVGYRFYTSPVELPKVILPGNRPMKSERVANTPSHQL